MSRSILALCNFRFAIDDDADEDAVARISWLVFNMVLGVGTGRLRFKVLFFDGEYSAGLVGVL